jgi:hypothetical protein
MEIHYTLNHVIIGNLGASNPFDAFLEDILIDQIILLDWQFQCFSNGSVFFDDMVSEDSDDLIPRHSVVNIVSIEVVV